MQIKQKLFIVLVAALSSQAMCAQTDADALPVRPTAERIVKETATVGTPATTVKAPALRETMSTASGDAIVQTALQYLGAKYRSGHSGPTAFDCSGFTSFIYHSESIALSRSSRSQFCEGTPVTSIRDLQKGDLVFFGGSSRSRTVGHVGIVTEVDPAANKFKFVHAARTGVQVDDSSSAYYSRRYMGARRIITD